MNAQDRTPTLGSVNPSLTGLLLCWQRQIESALAHGCMDHTFDDVVQRVLNKQAFFYCNADAFAIMEPITYSRSTVYHCWLAGGTLAGVLELEEHAARDARAMGCNRLTLTGRKGFARALKDHGWKEAHVTMIKPLPAEAPPPKGLPN